METMLLTLFQATGEGWEERVRERLEALRARFARTSPKGRATPGKG
ncbi:hypothetical protein [Thermus filiformis]|nr:hypothetical protein [Thermus filiformis]